MRRVLTHRQIVEWMAACRVDPFTESRADRRAAIVAWTIAAVNTPKGKPRPKVEDFMAVGQPKTRQSLHQMAAAMNSYATAHNAFLKQKRAKGAKGN